MSSLHETSEGAREEGYFLRDLGASGYSLSWFRRTRVNEEIIRGESTGPFVSGLRCEFYRGYLANCVSESGETAKIRQVIVTRINVYDSADVEADNRLEIQFKRKTGTTNRIVDRCKFID